MAPPRLLVERAERRAREILALAEEQARGLRERAVREGHEEGVARAVAETVAWRRGRAQREGASVSVALEVARALARRLIGRAIEREPSLVEGLVEETLHALGRAERVELRAHPADRASLESALRGSRELLSQLELHDDATLERGSLVASTELGGIDGRLSVRLERLIVALRELGFPMTMSLAEPHAPEE